MHLDNAVGIMNEITKQYKQRFGEVLKPLGFNLYKKAFYRVSNDVLQTLMLVRTDNSCSVEFNIKSLALGIDNLYCEGYSISQFREGNKKWCDWEFETFMPKHQNHQKKENSGEIAKGSNENANVNVKNTLIVDNDGSASEIVEKMLMVIISCIIPVFERGVDAKTAYEELIRVEKDIHTCVPGGVVMNNYGFVCLCIQAKDYEKAYQHMEAIVKQNIGIAEFDRVFIKREEEMGLYIDKCSNEIKKRIKVLQKLSIPDADYFQNLIAENEAKSFEYLKYPGRRKGM